MAASRFGREPGCPRAALLVVAPLAAHDVHGGTANAAFGGLGAVDAHDRAWLPALIRHRLGGRSGSLPHSPGAFTARPEGPARGRLPSRGCDQRICADGT